MSEYMKPVVKKKIREYIAEVKNANGTHDVFAYCMGYYGQISDTVFNAIMEMYYAGELKAGNGIDGKYIGER